MGRLQNFILLASAFVTTSAWDNSRYQRQVKFSSGGISPKSAPEGDCNTWADEKGNCIPVTKCPALLKQLQSRTLDIIKKSNCGFTGVEPKVCCPVVKAEPLKIEDAEIQRSIEIVPAPPNAPKECGTNLNATTTRIYGGTEATRGNWPWMASIFIAIRGLPTPKCGATLISSSHVLTAAHCLMNPKTKVPFPVNALTVRLGDHDLYHEEDDKIPHEDAAVQKVLIHENYNDRNYKNDIAILKLKEEVDYRQFIRPVCLPFGDLARAEIVGNSAFVTGWGATNPGGPGSATLQEVMLPIWKQESCVKAYREFLTLTNTYMCAGYPDGGKDSCEGDSGGPLVLYKDGRYYQYGIVSFGRKCALPGNPGVYTRIPQYMKWIADKMRS